MANNSILKLQVDDKQYEASLKNAQQGLTALQAALRNSGKSFADVDKQTEQYVRELGKMEATSKTTRGRIGEMSSAFVELSRVEKQLTDQERQSPVGKALTESLAQLKQRTIDAKNELQGLENQIKNVGEVKLPDTGGLFGGGKLDGMLQVFGGNLMTKAAGAVANLGAEMADMVKQGVEMAKAGEGVRIAFERLGRGDLLQGLRDATHGTVTDLELMKAAVQFNDFKLPLDQLGTMLAFAQQKAKDTGQSVDYLVQSIVTGLGRKSLMILDNLGLSATEIKERMKETGDMTKAVGAIIREQMAKAGDYVETASDRAAQANVSLQNKMEELGRKFAPVEEASNQLWTSIKIGILDIVGGPLAQLLNGLTEAGRLQNAINNMNGGGNGGPTRIDRMVSMLGDGKGAKSRNTYNKQLGVFDERINQQKFRIASLSGNDAITRGLRQKAELELKAFESMRAEYISRANDVFNAKPGTTTTGGGKDDKKKKEKELTELQQNQQKINDLTQEYVKLGDESTEAARERQAEIQKEISLLEKRNSLLGLRAEQAQGRLLLGAGDFQKSGLSNNSGTLLSTPNTSVSGLMLDDKAMKAVNKQLEAMGKSNIKQLAEVGKETAQSWRGAASAMSAASSALQGLEDPGAKIAGIVGQAIANIALGFSQATAASSGGGIFGWIAAIAGGLTTMLSTISAIHSATGYAQGGIVDGRGGGFVGGTAYSGDRVPAMLNSGELVLNRAQQGVLADALEGGNALQNLRLDAIIRGEQIRLVLNNNGRRTGRGEYVQTNRR